ncbi:MAG: hypothetical protein ACOCUZ_01660, partial [bacterium]
MSRRAMQPAAPGTGGGAALLLAVALLAVAAPAGAAAQDANLADGARVERLEVDPPELTLEVGERATFTIRALD